MQFGFLSLIALFITFSSGVASSLPVGASSCDVLFRPQISITGEIREHQKTGRFNREPNRTLDRSIFDRAIRDELLATEIDGLMPVTLLELKVGEEVAYFYFRELPSNHAVVADMVFVPESFRGRGISERLFAHAFAGRRDIKKIIFFLDRTNKEIFDRTPNLSDEERLRETPAFKSYSKFGFTKIEHISEVSFNGNAKKFPQVILTRDDP